MIGRGVFENLYCFANPPHTPTKEELLALLRLHLKLWEESTSNPQNEPKSFESLKHYFKIYIRDFNGASDLRAQMMACHSLPELASVLSSFQSL